MFDYPREFSSKARNAVETEKIEASRDLETKRRELPPPRFGNPPDGLEDLVIEYILRVFLVFARRACETGKRSGWALDRVRSTSLEFLRQFTLEAHHEKGHYESHHYVERTSYIRDMNADWRSRAAVLPWVMEKFEKSPKWTEYEELLLAYSGQAGGPKPELSFAEAEVDRLQAQEGTAAALAQPATLSTSIGQGRKRGPIPDYENAKRVAEIVARLAPDGNFRSKLDDICETLDEDEIPRPKTWKERGYRDWFSALVAERSLVVKAITHHLELHRTQEKTLG